MSIRISKNRVALSGIPLEQAQSAPIASAATVDLSTATGNEVHITGSTGPITAFDTPTKRVPAGTQFLLIFDSTPTINYDAVAMVLNTGTANYTCAAGDRAIAVSEGGGNWVVNIFKKDGTAVTAASGSGAQFTTDSSGNVTGLVGPGGYSLSSDLSQKVGFSVQQASVCVFDQLVSGSYVCTDGVSANGNSSRRLFLFAGDPVNLGEGTVTALAGTSCAQTTTILKKTTGAAIGATWFGTAHFATNQMTVDSTISGSLAIGQTVMAAGVALGTTITAGTGPYTLSSSPGTLGTRAVSTLASSGAIVDAWVVSNGDIFFSVTDGNTNSFLFRAKASTYTVGADAGYSDNKACIDLGLKGGTQSTDIRTLTKRSFLEATVNNAKHYFLCEYNVSASKTPGSTNDQCYVYRSIDAGNTWTIFLEFNTDGSNHIIDHFHGAKQDPYSGWIYFFTGDQTTECSIIGYNGLANALAANTSLATIATTAGYKLISGSELNRYTDICFAPGCLYGIPDADTEAADAAGTAFVATRIPKTLDYVESLGAVTRTSNIPPVLNLQTALFDMILSFRTSGEQYLHVWTSDKKDGSGLWTLVLKIKNYFNTSGVPRSLFQAQDGRIWIGALYAKGIYFSSGVLSGTSVALTPIPRPDSASLPTIFTGA